MPHLLTALLIDDEKRAVALLRKLLEETGEFNTIRYAFSADAGMEAVKKNVPDIIFLDIQMPNKDGFAFLKEIKTINIATEIIFVTAFDQYTKLAIKQHAFDYLMKPVVRDELQACIQAFIQKQQRSDFTSRLSRFLEGYEINKKIRFNTRTGFFQVSASNIVYCLADGNYTHINTGDAEQLCTLNLGHVQELLPQNGFIRLGRSHIINSHYIYKVDRKACEITFLVEGKQLSITVSVRQVKELDRLI